ncbi:MAG: hypothetical protein AAFR98_05565 [Pseudomonadota bacterium]
MRNLVVAALLAATPVCASDWFRHPFGELRAYHWDWLAVCQDEGNGLCRVVTFGEDAKRRDFPYSRLAIGRSRDHDGWSIEFTYTDMDAREIDRVTFVIDGREVRVPLANMDTTGLDTVRLGEPDVTEPLVVSMKPARFVEVRFDPNVTDPQNLIFSLRGLTAALAAVEAHETARQN